MAASLLKSGENATYKWLWAGLMRRIAGPGGLEQQDSDAITREVV